MTKEKRDLLDKLFARPSDAEERAVDRHIAAQKVADLQIAAQKARRPRPQLRGGSMGRKV